MVHLEFQVKVKMKMEEVIDFFYEKRLCAYEGD